MYYGSIKFGNAGEDGTICEIKFLPAVANLIRARLAEAGNHSFDKDTEAFAGYVAFYTAELADKKLCDLPEVDAIKPADIYQQMLKYDFTLNAPEDEKAEGEADENPTATKGARS